MTDATPHTAPVESEGQTPEPPRPNATRMIVTMGAVGLLASILLVVTFTWTAPYIAANQAAYLEASIQEVLQSSTSRTDWRLVDGALVPDDGSYTIEPRIFAGFRADSTLEGVAIEAQGQGYADVIRLLYGYSPDCGCVIGLKILESKETPGLGDKIGKDPEFLSNFTQLDVRLSGPDGNTRGPLEMIKQGSNLESWQIDAISGATISSQAVTDILNAANATLLPLIHGQLDDISQPPES